MAIESSVRRVKSSGTSMARSGPKRAHFKTICETISCISVKHVSWVRTMTFSSRAQVPGNIDLMGRGPNAGISSRWATAILSARS